MDAAWDVCSTYHKVLKASSCAAIFGRDMLCDIPFLAEWNKIGGYKKHQTNCNTQHENKSCIVLDYKIGYKALLCKEGILYKSESKYNCDP